MVRLFTIATAFAAIQYTVTAIHLQDVEPKEVEQNNDGALFVQYYKTDCKSCTDFAPKWTQLVHAHPHTSFAKVNCDQHVSYCNSKGLVRFPSIHSKINGGEWYKHLGDLNNVDQFIDKINIQLKRNPEGSSIELKTSQELKDIIESKEPWFVKFYAPWCGHCKQLAPIWMDLATKLKNKVNIAEVNCEESRSLCQEYKVTGLPTLKYFVHGATLKYTGKRELGPLQEYAVYMSGSPVHQLKYDNELDPLMKQHDVMFVHIFSIGDSGNSINQLETIAPGFMETVPFYASSDKRTIDRFNLSPQDLPASVMIKDDTYHIFHKQGDLAAWILEESKPLVKRILPHNFNSISKGQQVVVLGIIHPDDPTHAISTLRDIAKKYQQDGQQEDILFAQLDGKLWSNFVARVYGIHHLPAIVILDPKNELYYKTNTNDLKFAFKYPEEILEALHHLDQLTGISTAPSKTMSSIEKLLVFFGNNWLILTPILIVGFALSFYIMMKSGNDDETTEEIKKAEKKKN